jgi:chemotaxis signal transduction protein
MADRDEDELAEFRGEERAADDVGVLADLHDLLVFELGGDCFAVEATKVASVVTYRAPAPVPSGAAALAGVVQDAGRIIAVMHHPLGRNDGDGEPPTRLVVCHCARGLIGFPAHVTHGIIQTPVEGVGPLDTAFGAASLLEPDAVARSLGRA